MQQISENIYVETKLKGANTSIVTTKEGLVMIDNPHRPSDCLRLRDAIADLGEVRYLINTEHHIDHVTGNYFFPGTIIAHDETKRAMAETPMSKITGRVRKIDPGELSLMADYQLKMPTITFTERLTLYSGDHTFNLLHLPGHTRGQIAVHLPQERMLFTGDTVSYRVQIFMHECEPFQWLESLKKIEAIDVDIIVPGHGEVCDKSYLPELASFIQEWVDAVKGAIARGLSREEALDRISFLDRYPMDVGEAEMGPEVQRWNVGRLYDLLATSPPGTA